MYETEQRRERTEAKKIDSSSEREKIEGISVAGAGYWVYFEEAG